jgi:hypothetical protein
MPVRKIKNGRLIPTERDRDMFALFSDGHNFSEIADKYHLSRERIRQIITMIYGISGTDGGILRRYINEKKGENHKISKRAERISKLFGCSEELLLGINGKKYTAGNKAKGSKAHQYLTQVRNSKKRNIEWNLTFPQWWDIWEKSGKYNSRGRGKKYNMARYGDSGGYEIGNVYICTGAQNSSDQYLVREHHFIKRGKKTHCKRGHKFTEENTYLYVDRKGYNMRNCRECMRIRRKI